MAGGGAEHGDRLLGRTLGEESEIGAAAERDVDRTRGHRLMQLRPADEVDALDREIRFLVNAESDAGVEHVEIEADGFGRANAQLLGRG